MNIKLVICILKERSMRIANVVTLLALMFSVSGCAVVAVGADVVSAGTSVVSTAVDVTGDVVGAAASTITGSSDKSSKKN